MCGCLAFGRGGVGGVVGEWVRELSLGFIKSGGTSGKWDMCLCFGCGGVGGVEGEWVGGLGKNLGGWCYVCVRGESGFFMLMAGTCICVLC